MSNSHEDSLDTEEALHRFDQESDEILHSFLDPISGSEPPRIIYHYTNADGLKGILETGRLWLSDIFTLNDPSELEHGVKLAAGILKKNVANGPEGSKEFARFFEDFFKSEINMKRANYFICSFSSHGNDLAQWRAYANNGRGYALGFDAKCLQKAFETYGCDIPVLPAQAQRVHGTFPITYSDRKLAKIHSKIISLIPLPPPPNQSAWTSLLSTLAARVLTASLHFKHKAYSNEKEYRFLELHGIMKPRQVSLRTRPDALIKYREFDWKKRAAGSLQEIIVGPAADNQKGIQFARDCVRMFCSTPVSITQSDIPYRAL